MVSTRSLTLEVLERIAYVSQVRPVFGDIHYDVDAYPEKA